MGLLAEPHAGAETEREPNRPPRGNPLRLRETAPLVLGLSTVVEVERLFAEYCLAGACRRLDKIVVSVGRAGDHDCIDLEVGESLVAARGD
jgi:hypothetical protein